MEFQNVERQPERQTGRPASKIDRQIDKQTDRNTEKTDRIELVHLAKILIRPRPFITLYLGSPHISRGGGLGVPDGQAGRHRRLHRKPPISPDKKDLFFSNISASFHARVMFSFWRTSKRHGEFLNTQQGGVNVQGEFSHSVLDLWRQCGNTVQDISPDYGSLDRVVIPQDEVDPR